jgi:phosphatidylinositol alpha-1,6-mannosyltransferase
MPASEDRGTGSVEGFGIVYLEAAACEVPSVAGATGGVADAVVDGETGLLVDPLDEAALADALVRLLGDPALRERLGRQGRRRILEEFSWARLGEIVARETAQLS